MELAAVFIGSGIGAVLRWRCQALWNVVDGLPWGTLAVNLIGGFLAGVCLAFAAKLSGEARLFVVTGILGGLTTFSALSAEIVALGIRGAWSQALLYGIGSLAAGTLACWIGYSAASLAAA